jgi:F5/8 type C domain-containing protein
VSGAAVAFGCSVYEPSLIDGSHGGGGGSAGSGATGGDGGSAGTSGAMNSGGGAGSVDASDGAAGSDGDAESGASDGATSNDVVSDVRAERDDAATPDVGVSDGDACVSEGNAAFCDRVGKNCGTVKGNDNCGKPIIGNCGSCPSLQTCGGGGQASVCGALTDLAQGGTVTSSNPNAPPEDMTKAFDGQSSTKWFTGTAATAWIAYQFAGTTTHVVTSYAITSANDVPERDPSGWIFQGSNDGVAWTTLDSRSGEVFATRFQTNGYTCANTTAYPRYRLTILANAGATSLQLAEIQLFGN